MAVQLTPEEVQANKALATEIWGRDLGRPADVESDEFAEEFLKYHTEDYWNHASDPNEEPDRGLANAKAVHVAFLELFEDPVFEITRVTAENDIVVLEGDFSATVVGGALFGIPAARQFVTQPHVHTLRFDGGKIAEHWVVRDDLEMLQKMGGTTQRGSVTHFYHESVASGEGNS